MLALSLVAAVLLALACDRVGLATRYLSRCPEEGPATSDEPEGLAEVVVLPPRKTGESRGQSARLGDRKVSSGQRDGERD